VSDLQEIWYGRDSQKVLSKLEFYDSRLSDSLTLIKGYPCYWYLLSSFGWNAV